MKPTLRILMLAISIIFSTNAQEISCTTKKSTMFTDEYKLSGIVSLGSDGKGGITIARWYESYYGKAHGYVIEHYNDKMAKIKSYDHKMKKGHLLDIMVNTDTVSLIEFTYDKKQHAYICYANSANIKDFKFTRKELFRLAMKKESIPIMSFNPDVSRFEDDKHAKITYNKDKSIFAVCVDINTGKEKNEVHDMYIFNRAFKPLRKGRVKDTFEKDEFEIENMDVSTNGTAYVLARVKEKDKKKKKNGGPGYYYELITIGKGGTTTTTFDTGEHFAGFLKVLAKKDGVACVGFYSDRGEFYQKGVCYFGIDASGTITSSKFSPFDDSFIQKYSKKTKKELDDFRFVEVMLTKNNEIIFNGEEFKVDTYTSGTGKNISFHTTYSYRDIISVKLNETGDVAWVRNIDKGQFTNGAAAKYFSYSSMMLGDDMYFFINGNMSTSESGKLYLSCKGLQDTDLNIVRINSNGQIEGKKLLSASEIKVPFMVNEGGMLPEASAAYFLGREGKDKQLLKVTFP